MICPTPDKVAYRSIYDATRAALKVLEEYQSPSRPYECECESYHLTTKPMFGSVPLQAAQVRELAYQLGVSR